MSIFSKISKVFTADWKTLIKSTRQLKKDSGRGFFDLLLDQTRMYKRGGYTWAEYSLYEFDRITDPKLRANFGSEYYDNKRLVLGSSTPESRALFRDKSLFNEKFGQYLRRDYLDLCKCSESDFMDFAEKHQVFFAKIPTGHGGAGVSRIERNESTDLQQLYQELLAKEQTILEEEIILHEAMRPVSPTSLCSLRIGTVLQKDGSVVVLYNRLRTAMHDPIVDNISRGGGYTAISDQGELMYPCVTFKPSRRYVAEHPVTGAKFVGFQIPMFDQVQEYVRELAQIVPEQAYVGWDITLNEHGPLLIEGNEIPSLYMYQAAQFYPDDIGPRANLERIFDISLPAPEL
ncbi:MAG TPA: sugar-transfer associated ATP-grasp domain-containing protein [Oscillospiraceae bacterium]|nr:sugar-transfer associated ATP-grasp domain-containing protein [Oscillospiraceae bacterium]